MDHEFRLNDAPILWYCVEECRRQELDVREYAGMQVLSRVLDAWVHAMSLHRERPYPELADVIKIARLVNPEANHIGLRRSDVVVGGHRTPPFTEVAYLLKKLLGWRNGAGSATAWYHEFERIHPARQGNRFVGLILMNWIAGTLHAPFLPLDEARGVVVDL